MKEIYYLLVKRGTQVFRVYNKKKIDFWLKQAENSLRASGGDNELAQVKILKKVLK